MFFLFPDPTLIAARNKVSSNSELKIKVVRSGASEASGATITSQMAVPSSFVDPKVRAVINGPHMMTFGRAK